MDKDFFTGVGVLEFRVGHGYTHDADWPFRKRFSSDREDRNWAARIRRRLAGSEHRLFCRISFGDGEAERYRANMKTLSRRERAEMRRVWG